MTTARLFFYTLQFRGTVFARACAISTKVFAAVGLLFTVWAIWAATLDFFHFDETSGGYEAPYTGWTGKPIDWKQVDVSPDGFARRGTLIDVLVNCTTGMIEFDVFGIRVPFRVLSNRALVVHRPREACVLAGFNPRF